MEKKIQYLLIVPPAALVSAGSQSTGFNRLLSSYKPE